MKYGHDRLVQWEPVSASRIVALFLLVETQAVNQHKRTEVHEVFTRSSTLCQINRLAETSTRRLAELMQVHSQAALSRRKTSIRT